MTLRTRVQFACGPSCTAYKPLFNLPAWDSRSLTDANLLDQAAFRSIMHRITARQQGSGSKARLTLICSLNTATHSFSHHSAQCHIDSNSLASLLSQPSFKWSQSDWIARMGHMLRATSYVAAAHSILSFSHSFIYAQRNCGLRTSKLMPTPESSIRYKIIQSRTSAEAWMSLAANAELSKRSQAPCGPTTRRLSPVP
jgi:hypothetical protein